MQVHWDPSQSFNPAWVPGNIADVWKSLLSPGVAVGPAVVTLNSRLGKLDLYLDAHPEESFTVL